MGFERAASITGLVLAMSCQSSGATRLDDPPRPVTAVESAGGQAGNPNMRAEPEPIPQAEPQPAPAALLVERLFELARDWKLDDAVARIERALEVELSGDDSRRSGTSARWPMTVAYHPPRSGRRGTLHISFTDATSVDLAEMTRRFGAAATRVESKESLVEFDGPAGVRIVAGLLGGLTPTSPVAWIRLEDRGPRPPPPKDLF